MRLETTQGCLRNSVRALAVFGGVATTLALSVHLLLAAPTPGRLDQPERKQRLWRLSLPLSKYTAIWK